MARIRVSVACSISCAKRKALWWECSHKTHGGLMSQHDLRHRKLPTVDYASKFNWVCQSRVAQFHGEICPMPYCSDGALQFLRLARLRRCFIFQMCAGPLPFGQPTHAAYPCSLHRFKQLFIQFTHTLGQAWCERQDGWGKRSWENCFS